MAVLLGVAFLPAGAIAMQSGLSAVGERQAAIQQQVGAREVNAITSLRDELIQLREVARTLAANADLFADNRTVCSNTLRAFSNEFPNFATLSVIDSRPVIICSNRSEAIGQQSRSGPLLQDARRAGRAILDYSVTPRYSNGPVFVAIAPAEAGEQELYVGVARLATPLLSGGLQRSAGRDPYRLIVDENGGVLARAGAALDPREQARLTQRLDATLPSTPSGAFRVGETWAVITPLEDDRLYLLQGWSPTTPTLLQRAELVWALVLPLLLWLGAIVVAWYAIELYVARPLSALQSLARSYARGEATDETDTSLLDAPSEISSLRRTLAAMAKTLTGREARLAEALSEERALLRELHHRVRNNLQMVASILAIQARSADDEAEARGLARARDRVQILAITHAQLYASGEVREIPLDQLAAEVVRTLVGARPDKQIRLVSEFDPLRVEADRAVAVAFLIGEAASIAIDDAPKGAEISVNLRAGESGAIMLEILSPEAPRAEPSSPAALRLIQAYARQLHADVGEATAQVIRITVPARETAPALEPAPVT